MCWWEGNLTVTDTRQSVRLSSKNNTARNPVGSKRHFDRERLKMRLIVTRRHGNKEGRGRLEERRSERGRLG